MVKVNSSVAAAAETCTTSANAQDAAKPGGVYTIASISAKLLRKPSISSSVKDVGIASRGAVARLLENGPNGQFVRIEILAAGPSLPLRAARGWTPADAIRPAPESLAPTPLKPGQRAWVDAYTIPLIPKPEAEGTVLSAKGWVKRGSEVEVIERFLDPTDGPFIRFKLLKAADGSKPLAEEAWTPEANLTAQKSD